MRLTAWCLVVVLVACTSVRSTVVVAHPTPGCVPSETMPSCEQQVEQVRPGRCDEQTADPGDRIVGCHDEKKMRGGAKAILIIAIVGAVIVGVIVAAAVVAGSSSTTTP
jgi:hypothetical protein